MGAVYREELSANARKLIEQLLSLPQGWVTAAALAESIGVSRRTVLRELPAVEQWMQAAGAHFVRNPGKGLLLDEAPERRDALRTQLNSGDRKKLSRAERRQQLLTRLLSEQEPCKTAVLARALGVSESTLSADLDELETKLHPYRVEMFRRPGVGVWLQGDASSYRRVVSALLRSSMPEKELAEVLCGRMPENEIFSTLLDTKTAEKVWAVLQQFEQEEQLHLPDAGFLALAIHCTLTIQQLRQGGDKGSAPRGLRPAGNHAARLVAALNRAFGLTLPPEEAQYLELYLSAYLGAEDPWGSAQEMELRNLEAALIREMEKALHTDLSGYTSLRDDLYCHLRPMLLRVEQNIRTENPQLDTIRTAYPGLWKATRAACDAVQQQFVLPAISDDEAAYLAMHFGAVLEQNAMFRLQLRVVVACPLGMGSSRFLASRLGNEFPSLQVEGCCSVRELTGGTGFDDVFCYAPIAPVVELSSAVLGRDGCLNFFAGPTDKQFSAKMNFYDVHYNSTHVMGTTGGNTADMIESLELTAAKRIDPAVMVTHIGGLNAAAETTLNLPKIPGGKKLIYTHLTMPLIALTDLRAKGEQDNDPRYTALADIVDAHNGLWCPEAEEYLLANFNPED